MKGNKQKHPQRLGVGLTTEGTHSTDTGLIPTRDPHETLSEQGSYAHSTDEITVADRRKFLDGAS